MRKIFYAILALLLAGSALFLGGWKAPRVRAGVTVNTVNVGGMSWVEAEKSVREHIQKGLPAFTVHTPDGEEKFKLDFSDNVAYLVRTAKKGEALTATVRLEWAGMEEELNSLCNRFAVEAEDAALTFSAAGFSYTTEKYGTACDYAGLIKEVAAALAAGKTEATLRTYPFAPKVTKGDLKARTRLLASFTTKFDTSNAARCHNIALAASNIAGTVIEAGGEFSFNGVVGKRTKENGFMEAAVIQGGEFVQGVGGGVCQASTTLMNAALRAGMQISESHPHSLSVGYVPPSLDAMVSEYSDLKFINPYSVPVYVQAHAGGGRVTFSLYGLPDGRRYAVESKVLLKVDPPPEKVVEGEEDLVLRAEKQGIASESYLLVYEGETLISRTRLRRDTYAVVQGIRQVKPVQESEEESVEEEAPPQI